MFCIWAIPKTRRWVRKAATAARPWAAPPEAPHAVRQKKRDDVGKIGPASERLPPHSRLSKPPPREGR